MKNRWVLGLVSVVIICVGLVFQSQADIASGLVAHWPLDGNANDASGNNRNGQLFGGVLTTDRFWKPNAAIDFSEAGSYVVADNTNNVFGSAPFTVSFWRKGYGEHTAVCLEDTNSVVWAVGGIAGQLHVDENVELAGSRTNLYLNITYSASDWNQIVLVYNGSSSGFYLNGQLVSNFALPALANSAPSHKLYIGADPYAGTEFFQGAIDDIRIYNRALSSDDIAELYDVEGSPCGGCVGPQGPPGVGVTQGMCVMMATNAPPPAGFTLLGTTKVKYQYEVDGKKKSSTQIFNLYQKD